MDIVRILNSIGKENFVTFYDDYKQYHLSDNKAEERELLARKLLNDNLNAQKISGQYTRINCARRIFEERVEKEALKIILNARVSDTIKNRAKELLEL